MAEPVTAVWARRRCRGSRGAAGAIELTLAVPVLLAMVLAILQAAIWWHVRNLVEQAAEEGVRLAAAYDGDCSSAVPRASAMAEMLGGQWIGTVHVACQDGETARLSLDARALSLFPPFELTVRATAAAPEER